MFRRSFATLAVRFKCSAPLPPCPVWEAWQRWPLERFPRLSFSRANQNLPPRTCTPSAFCCGNLLPATCPSPTTLTSSATKCYAAFGRACRHRHPKVSQLIISNSWLSAGQTMLRSGPLQSKLSAACCTWTPVPAPCRAPSSCGILLVLVHLLPCSTAS